MDDLASALSDAGGLDAPRERAGQLRALLMQALRDGAEELTKPRSGYESPVTVVIARTGDGLRAALPVPHQLRADPDAIPERAWLLTAATVAALSDAGARGAPLAGHLDEHLVLDAPGADDPELAVLAFDEQIADVDRLKARALAVPAHVLEATADLKPPIGQGHPIVIAHHVAQLGGRPTDPGSVSDLEDELLSRLALADPQITRPHEDPDPARRAARRILQRLNGMGKWGGFHTEFAHLARGFAPSDKQLAQDVGEALLAAELLLEKPSVGQRHVFLNPRRAKDIHALIDDGATPPDLRLP